MRVRVTVRVRVRSRCRLGFGIRLRGKGRVRVRDRVRVRVRVRVKVRAMDSGLQSNESHLKRAIPDADLGHGVGTLHCDDPILNHIGLPKHDRGRDPKSGIDHGLWEADPGAERGDAEGGPGTDARGLREGDADGVGQNDLLTWAIENENGVLEMGQ